MYVIRLHNPFVGMNNSTNQTRERYLFRLVRHIWGKDIGF